MIRLKKNKILNSMVNGSFTVEMSLILPIILMIVFLIIYMIFYEHDNVRSQNILFQNIRKTEQEYLTKKYWKRGKTKSERDNNIYKNGFFILKCKNYKSTKNVFIVKEYISMGATCSIPYVESLLKDIGMNFNNELAVPLYNPSGVLRVYYGISQCPDSENSWNYRKKYFDRIKKVFTFKET